MPLNIYQFHPKVLISGEFQNHGQNNLKKVSVHGTGNKNNIYHQIHVHMLQCIHADIVTDHTDQRPAWELYKSTRVQFYHPRCTQAQCQDTTQIKDQLGISTNLPEYSFTIPGTLRRNARTPHRSKTSLGSLQIYQSTVLPSPVHSGAMPGHHADQRPAWDLYKSTSGEYSFTIPGALRHNARTPRRSKTSLGSLQIYQSTVLPSPVHSGTTPGHHTDQRPAWDPYKSTRVQFYHPQCTQAQCQDTTQIKDQLGISTNLPVESTVLPSPVHSGTTPGHHADQRPAWDLYKSTRVQFYHPWYTQAQRQDTTQIKDQLGIPTNLPEYSFTIPSALRRNARTPRRSKTSLGSLQIYQWRVQFYHPRCTQAQCQDTTQIKDQLGISTNLPEYSFTIPGALRHNASTPRRSKTSLGSLQIYQSTVLPSPMHSGAMPGHHADQRPAWDLYTAYFPLCTTRVIPRLFKTN